VHQTLQPERRKFAARVQIAIWKSTRMDVLHGVVPTGGKAGLLSRYRHLRHAARSDSTTFTEKHRGHSPTVEARACGRHSE
jgi:hypothetical protein